MLYEFFLRTKKYHLDINTRYYKSKKWHSSHLKINRTVFALFNCLGLVLSKLECVASLTLLHRSLTEWGLCCILAVLLNRHLESLRLPGEIRFVFDLIYWHSKQVCCRCKEWSASCPRNTPAQLYCLNETVWRVSGASTSSRGLSFVQCRLWHLKYRSVAAHHSGDSIMKQVIVSHLGHFRLKIRLCFLRGIQQSA